MVGLMSSHFIPPGKEPPLDRRLGGPQSWSECGDRQEISAPARNLILVIQPVAQSLY